MPEILKRLLSGIVYILLIVSATFYTPISYFALISFFLVVSAYEFSNLLQLPKVTTLAISVFGFSLFAFFEIDELTKMLLVFSALFVSSQLLYALFTQQKLVQKGYTVWVYLIGYVIIPFILLAKIPFEEGGYLPKVVLSLFILIWINDTFAYLTGRAFGKHKLFEAISPKKTIEGFVGGVLFCILGGYLLATYFLNTMFQKWIIIAVLVGIFGTLGDLVESKFKRTAGVKDSGTIMPGHGGLLDRLDSIIFATPFIYLFYQILHYVS